MDLLFDVWGKIWNNSVVDHLRERLLFGLALMIPSIVFLKYRNSNNIAVLYLALINGRNAGFGATLYIAVYKELQRKSKLLLPCLLFFGIIMLFAYSISSFYGIIFAWPPSIQRGLISMNVVSIIILIYSLIHWFRITLKRNREHAASFSLDEYSCIIAYFVPTILVGILTFLWTTIHNELTWENRSEDTLVFLMMLQFFYAVAVTIIPGRIVRLLAVSTMNSLILKQVFVRFVSHEIRSPLHVVLAGLELLRCDINATVSERNVSILELIDDMQSAGETAISILNDLLQYENMDAGTLKLEQSWKPLKNLLQGKLKWASILAAKKNVNLSITDS
mmetsp:Transcript_19291/g.26518  ORF Transcript_19291/g.26518 Transcript_19291/m.26518 type:complete len:335 (+) Transcript_19291:297-1301(+)